MPTSDLAKDYYLERIPQFAHFIWSHTSGLPLTRFLSIAGFALLNPHIQVFAHTFQSSQIPVKFHGGEDHAIVTGQGRCYWNDVKELSNVNIVYHDIEDYNISSSLAPSTLSDILRWKVLVESGGWYFDTDILFFVPFVKSYFNSRLYTNYDCFVNGSKKYIPPLDAIRIGFLGCAPNCRLFYDVMDVVMKENHDAEYQSAGAMPLSRLLGIGPYRSWCDRYPDLFIHNVQNRFLYCYETSTINRMLYRPVESLGWGGYQLGFHWYGGAYAREVTAHYDVWDEFMPEKLLTISDSFQNTLINSAFHWAYSSVRALYYSKMNDT